MACDEVRGAVDEIAAFVVMLVTVDVKIYPIFFEQWRKPSYEFRIRTVMPRGVDWMVAVNDFPVCSARV